MTIPVLCVLAAAAGVVVGFLLTHRASRQELQLAWRAGVARGRLEQADRTAFLERRVIHLEASLRRFSASNGVRP